MTNLKLFFTVMINIGMLSLSGQNNLKTALKEWENGDIDRAQKIVLQLVNENHENEEAKHLLMKAWFVQGNYPDALKTYNSIKKGYRKYRECTDLAIQAYIHLNKYEDAVHIAEQNKSAQLSYLNDFKNRPFTVLADQTYHIPFLYDQQIPSDYWPGVEVKINGIACSIRFDTGADYMVVGLSAAQKLGIGLHHKTKSIHAATKVKAWHSILDSMVIDNGPSFLNIPVTVMASLGDYIIFGTNMLEPFLATIDYPNNQFILTPRSDSELIEGHFSNLTENSIKLPFWLWDDHYLIAKGRFANYENLNFFFDSGLIVLTEIDEKPVQAGFTASGQA
jgi:tetratricopeptide (TPR) repeat protein